MIENCLPLYTRICIQSQQQHNINKQANSHHYSVFIVYGNNIAKLQYEFSLYITILAKARVFNASCIPCSNKFVIVSKEKSHHLFAISSLSALRSILITLVISNLFSTRSRYVLWFSRTMSTF